MPLEPASPAENPRAPVLRGRLLAPDGRPYGRGEVRFAWIRHGRAELVRTKTRADGGFELFPGEPSARGDLLATAFEHELGPVARLDVAAGEQGLELRLAPARTLELRFRDQDGGELVPAELSFHWILAGVTREDEEQSLGKTRWALPPVPFRIHVHDARVVEEWLGPFEPAEVGEVLTLGLHRRPFVRGLVLAAGRPVEGAEVRLEPLAIDPGSTRLRVFPSPARTDARGEFQVRVDEPGTFQARVFHPQHGLGRSGPWTVEPERDLAGLTLELTEPAGAIAGRVVLPVGRQPEEVAIRIGDRTRTLDAEGSFTLPGLEPGLHVLQPVQGKPGAALGAWTWTNAAPLGWLTHELALLVEVRSGGTSEAVLDLVTPPPVRLAGRIEVGVEVSDATGFGNFEPQGVRFDGAARDEGRARLRAGGAFAAGFGGPGARRLRVELLLEPDLACWSVSDEVVLAPGDNRWDLALVPGKLRLVMDGAPGEELELSPQPVLRWNDGSRAIEVGARIGGLAQASPGTLLYEAVPPGRVRFVLGPGGTEFEAFVRPGETTEFRFPASARAELRAAFDVRASGLVAPSYLGDQGFY
ncbi:MAG TPA: carboxypeptidase-like regulatory domain-containing protein [Planctomycetota bacterium]